MTEEKYNLAIEEAEFGGLYLRSVTGALTGYPSPMIGEFVYGFDTLEDVEKFAEEYGGEVSHGFWKDGWQLCNVKGRAYEYYTPSEKDYGNDYMVVDDEELLLHEAWWLYNDVKKDEAVISEMDPDEKDDYECEMINLKRYAENLIDDCKDIDWKEYSVILCCGLYYDIVRKESLSFSHDTKHYEIGVWLSNDFNDED